MKELEKCDLVYMIEVSVERQFEGIKITVRAVVKSGVHRRDRIEQIPLWRPKASVGRCVARAGSHWLQNWDLNQCFPDFKSHIISTSS